MGGLYYEDCTPGLVIEHEVRRTVSESDNILFSCLSMNTARLHLDEHYMQETEFGTRLVNSLFTLALVIGLSVSDVALGTSIANLAFEDTRFPAPVKHGDTIRSVTEVVDRRLSSKRPDAGVITFAHRGLNQHDTVVCVCRRVALHRLREPAGV